LPWLLSSFAIFILLHKERVDARNMKMTERRYTRLQMLKLLWSILFFLPLLIAVIASTNARLILAIVLLHSGSFWKMIVWCTVVHW
jgi:hypothetical protein